MIKRVSVLAVLLVMLAISAAPASAVTGDYVQDFEHPFVGLVVFYDESGEFIGRCSGSLLTPTVFLTAGHCVVDATTARVYFQQDAGANYDPATELDPVTGYPETCAPGTLGVSCATSTELYNYGFPASFPNRKDAGLVILDQQINVAEYGVLAGAGFLDTLATRRGLQELTFTISGYGLSYTNPVKTLSFRERLMAESRLVNLRNALTRGYNLQTTNNPGIGGGACFGDSGGPVFYGTFGSNLVVGLTSFGMNNLCGGVDFAYRTDQADLIAWILASVPQDQASLIQIVSQ